MIKYIRRLFAKKCDHVWLPGGWSCLKCDKCGKINSTPADVNAYWKQFWDDRTVEGHPDLDRNAINSALMMHQMRKRR